MTVAPAPPPTPSPDLAPLKPTLPTYSTAPTVANDPPGAGVLYLTNPDRATFATQRACYPLKFLIPAALPSGPPNVGLAYAIAYGGGLVAGDNVRIDTTVDAGCTLVLLTQGSTKLYKHRPGMRPQAQRLRYEDASADGEATLSRQRMFFRVAPGGVLLLLPDSVSPFRDSRYAQAQRVELADGASALVLDWVNSGRGERPPQPTRVTSRGRWKKWDESVEGMTKTEAFGDHKLLVNDGVADTEVWAMGYYASTNEIVTGPNHTVVARERMVLDNREFDTRTQGTAVSPVAARLAPYHVYATVLLYGPAFAPLRTLLDGLGERASQFQLPRPPGLLWSYSPLGDGGILRVAGVEVEDVRAWIREVMEVGGVKELVGAGVWPRCI